MSQRGLSEEQRLMRQSCRAFVDDVVIPFIRKNWQREWMMDPDGRLPDAAYSSGWVRTGPSGTRPLRG